MLEREREREMTMYDGVELLKRLPSVFVINGLLY